MGVTKGGGRVISLESHSRVVRTVCTRSSVDGLLLGKCGGEEGLLVGLSENTIPRRDSCSVIDFRIFAVQIVPVPRVSALALELAVMC